MKLEDLPTNADWTVDDWKQTFGGEDYSGTYEVGPAGVEVDDVTPERIAKVLHWHAHSPDGYGSVDFYAVVRLTDGQYAVSEAWADTTGWGCQADAWWKVGPSEASVLMELSPENREAVLRGESQ